MLNLKLLSAELRAHSVRLTLASLAVAAATALMVWTTGTATTGIAQHNRYVEQMTGPYCAWVVPDRPKAALKKGFGMQQSAAEEKRIWKIPSALLDALHTDTRIRRMDAFSTVTVQVEIPTPGKKSSGPRPRVTLAASDAEQCPFGNTLIEGDWLSGEPGNLPEAVVSTGAFFFRAPPATGEVITVFSEHGPVSLRVVGLMRQPRAVSGFPTLFVRQRVFDESFRGRTSPECNLALIEMKHPEELPALISYWAETLKAEPDPCRIEDRTVVLDELQAGVMAQFARGAPLVLSLAVLATLCILITTLSMGVHQRMKSLAMLRAAGLSRFGVFRFVLAEGVVILAAGLMVGLAAGYGLLALMVLRMPQLFPNGARLGPLVYTTSIICAALGVLVSALFPAWRAARLRPLDVLQQTMRPTGRWPRVFLWVGPLLLLPAPILALRLPLPVHLRCTLLIGLALPAVVAGCILAAPLALIVTERLFGGVLGFLCGIDPRLLRGQLTREPARNAGAAITLSLGLGLYIAIQTWGASMLAPFVPSREFPDAIVSFLPAGLSAEEWACVKNSDGVNPDQCFPLEARQYVLGQATLDHMAANPEYVMNQNNILLLGVDPAGAFGGSDPLCRFRFVQGDARDCAQRLAEESACIIPRMFADQSRLNKGDTIDVRVPVYSGGEPAGERIETLTIAGVVDINWHLITARSGLRGLRGSPFATLSPVFVSYAHASAWTGPEQPPVRFAWLNLNEAWRARPAEQAAAELPVIWRKQLRNPALEIRLSHRDDVTAGTIRHAADILEQMARIPLWSLAVLALGMVNTMLVGIQTRRFELGVLRAAGLTRTQLARLIGAEALMIGLSACVLSLVFGIESGWCFTGYSRGMMAFGGLPVAFIIPWKLLLTGIGLTLLLSLPAAVIPALLYARRATTDLLRP